MMLRSKRGSTEFKVVTKNDTIRVELDRYLMPWQIAAMTGKPDMIVQFAQHLAGMNWGGDTTQIQVFAVAVASVDEGPRFFIVDSTMDLAKTISSPFSQGWIIREPASGKLRMAASVKE